jgi:glutamate mutase epsilon subunit
MLRSVAPQCQVCNSEQKYYMVMSAGAYVAKCEKCTNTAQYSLQEIWEISKRAAQLSELELLRQMPTKMLSPWQKIKQLLKEDSWDFKDQ